MKKFISVVCLVMSLLLVLCGCGSSPIEWKLNDLGGDVDFHTDAQRKYLEGNYLDLGTVTGNKEASRPQAITLSWTATPKDVTVSSYTVELSTDKQFGSVRTYAAEGTEVEINNLLLAQTYYWRVRATLSDGKTVTSEPSDFTTTFQAPRNLYVDGITNVRDLGGWETLDGGVVRQGMIFRCARLNESKTETVKIEITEEGKRTMLEDLGVKSEIDLRMKEAHGYESGGITSSPLGDSVTYYNVELEWNNGNYLLNNQDSVRRFFELASDEKNYPFIFHCDIGTDRTGMFAFLINGLCGVSEEDLYRDYLFSNFGKIGGSRSLSNIENNYLATIKAAEGDTLSEKIENCLTTQLNIPLGQLEAIKDIMKDWSLT